MQQGHVLFFNPPSSRPLYRGIVCTWVSKAKYLWQPFDFILLSALVPAEMKVSYLDSFIHKACLNDAIKFIEDNAVTHIVMSMSSIEWQSDFNALIKLRSRFPELNIAVLGDVFQEFFFVRQVLPLNVAIIRHPLDLGISEYFSTGKTDTASILREIDAQVLHLPLVNLKPSVDFPMPRHEVFLSRKHRSPFDKHIKSATVNISWGCPYKCSYCSWSSPYTPFAYKTAKSVISELELLHKLGIREIFFADLVFGNPKAVALEVMEAMDKKNMKFSWHCYIRPGSLSEDFLKIMRKTGCHTIIIGVESFNSDLSRFNRSVSLEEIKKTIFSGHKLGMDICGDFIIGLNESAIYWRDLVRFAVGLKLDFASFNVYTPLLGSQERARKIKDGVFKEGEWGFDTTACKKSLIEHYQNRRRCVKMFYCRPGYWLKRLFKIRTFDEIFIKLDEAVSLFGIGRR